MIAVGWAVYTGSRRAVGASQRTRVPCPEEEDPSGRCSSATRASLDLSQKEVRVLASVLLASVTVPVLWVVGAVLIVAGIVYMFRRRMLLGVVLLIIGILLGGLNIFGVFD